jgi:uncharacterized protein (TIGR00369 family)
MREADSAAGPPDPEAIAALSGLEIMRRLLDGRLPPAPIARVLDFALVEVAEGRAVFEGRPSADHYNPMGGVHGGWFGALLDSAMGCAVMNRLPKGRAYVTLDYKITLLRGLTAASGPVRAEGLATQVGARAGFAEGRLFDGAGRLAATGSTTCLVFDAAGPSP